MAKERTLNGKLNDFSEMGGRGTPVWALNDGQDLYYVKSGDVLTVFNDASKKKVVWSGVVQLSDTKKPHPQPNTCQSGMSLKDWRKMFAGEYPAELKTKAPQKLFF